MEEELEKTKAELKVTKSLLQKEEAQLEELQLKVQKKKSLIENYEYRCRSIERAIMDYQSTLEGYYSQRKREIWNGKNSTLYIPRPVVSSYSKALNSVGLGEVRRYLDCLLSKLNEFEKNDFCLPGCGVWVYPEFGSGLFPYTYKIHRIMYKDYWTWNPGSEPSISQEFLIEGVFEPKFSLNLKNENQNPWLKNGN